ncbi:hypothetical protein LPJ79_004172 [Coemansia sp. RSA 1821]|nr:hypothetical protein LPJ79_004172 [Coemansia sp. RSA 1821]KAJ2650435.1 hypothetical protein IWW40_002398 [Coemansia sp. RSA 1250]KAJ2673168.1 hypothetical protein IWW42_002453 [Coemansia sp. RSA 1085]
MMGRTTAPDLKLYMDKKLSLELNGNRTVIGILRGYDAFMNINLENAQDVADENNPKPLNRTVIRGNSIVAVKALEAIGN